MKLIQACLASDALLFSGSVLAYGVSDRMDKNLPSDANKTSSSSKPSGFLALGAGVAPAFDGTDAYEAIPFFFGNVNWHGVNTEIRGLGLRFDLLADSALDVGPIFNYRVKRNSSDGSGRVRRLKDVDGAAELGGFIGYRFGGAVHGQEQLGMDLSIVHDVSDVYNGTLITGHVSYAALRSRELSVHVGAQTTWGDQDYQQTYFGISRSNAARSGLSTYRPSSGFRDVTLGVTVSHQFTERWGVLARGSLTRYVGDTADSPITREGSKTVGLMGVAGTYRF